MKFYSFASLLLLCSPAWLAAQIAAPMVGFARYPDSSVEAVYGLPGNFVVTRAALGTAGAISFSDYGGLLSRSGKILLLKADATPVAEYDTAEASPLLSVTGDLTTALAWLPAGHLLLHWSGSRFVAVPVDDAAFPGNATSLSAVNADHAAFLVTQPNGSVSQVLVSLTTGAVISSDQLPGVRGFAVRQQSFTVFHDDRGLEIESTNGNLRTLLIEANDLCFERMSSHWLHLYSPATKQHWALRLDAADATLAMLPAAPAKGGRQ